MSITLSTPVITALSNVNVIQTTNYTVPVNSKWFVAITDIDNSNISANNTECNLRTFSGTDMGAAVARIASDTGGTGQLKNAYAFANPAAGAASIAIRHPSTNGNNELFSVSSENSVSLYTSQVFYGNSNSASIAVPSQPGDLVVFSVTLNNNNPTAITASSTAPYNNQTLAQSGGADTYAGSRIFTKVADAATTSAAWSFSAANRWAVVAFVFRENTASITSIPNPVRAGASTPLSVAGFADGAAVFNLLGFDIPITLASGSANPTFPNFADGEVFPLLPVATATATVSQGGISGTASVDVNAASGYVKQTFVAAITDNPKLLGKAFFDAGFTVEGSAFFYIPVNGLIINADTGGTISSAGSTTGWLRDVSTGVMSFWSFTINNAGEISSATRFLNASQLSAKFLSCSFLSSEYLAQ